MDEQSAPPAGAGATDAGQGSAPAPAPAPSDAPPTLLHALLSQPPSNARALFFSNLLLLGFDPARPVASSVAPFLSAAELAAKTDAAEEKDPLDADMFAKGGLTGSGKAFECTARFLFGIIDASQAKEVRSTTYESLFSMNLMLNLFQRFGASLYTLNRVDSKQFRNVAFEWISALKKQNMLKGDEIVVRRSALDECRGERWAWSRCQ